MRNFIVKLTFRSPVHFGYKEKTYQMSEVTVSADTLFSALCNCWRLMYGSADLGEMLGLFTSGNAPFVISSTFPYHREELFVPKPVGLDLSDVTGDYKKAKKIKFIPLKCLIQQAEFHDYQEIKQGFMLKRDVDCIYSSREIPRVVKDCITETTEIYYVQSVFFEEEAGLYFLLTVYDEAMLPKIRAAINLLGDEGLGGERTYGYGLFTADFIEAGSFAADADSYMLLSPYLPRPDEVNQLVPVSFELRRRNGWVYSMGGQNIRRKSVMMFAEGSVFRNKLQGTIADVTPTGFTEHRVYRYGLAYALPVRFKGELYA